MDWDEKERGIGHFHAVIQAHTTHNSPSMVDNELVGKGKRHWSLPVIHAHIDYNPLTRNWRGTIVMQTQLTIL